MSFLLCPVQGEESFMNGFLKKGYFFENLENARKFTEI